MSNRMLKDTICTSDKIASLSDFEFRLWIGLLVSTDDFGRGDARPAVIKGRVFPLQDVVTSGDVACALSDLSKKGCIHLYKVGGKPFYCFPTWEKHQRIRQKVSKYPAPGDGTDGGEVPPETHDGGELPQVAADGGEVPPETHDGGELPQVAADGGEVPPETNKKPNQVETKEKTTGRGDPAVAAVCSDYLDRINASASQTCLQELANYAKAMGPEVCKRAFDIALDAKKATWNYIRGILRNWSALGVKCLTDIDTLDRKEGKARGEPGGSAEKFDPTANQRHGYRTAPLD